MAIQIINIHEGHMKGLIQVIQPALVKDILARLYKADLKY